MPAPLLPPILPPAQSASRPQPPLTQARGPVGESFARLLAEVIGSRSRRPLAPQAGSSDSNSLLTLPWGFGFAPVEEVITATLIKLIEGLQAGPASPLRAVPTGLPVAGAISQAYRSGHRAMDIAVPVGTPVRATGTGRVLYAGWNNEGYGNLVILENGPYRTYYAHLDRLLVRPGEGIEAGAIVGLSGNTGNSTGPHLHYEVRLNGAQVMPDIA